jgi:NAD(P)H-hydrate epimerase
LEAQRALVLDADALTSFEGRLDELSGFINKQHQNLVVATPHEGEFVRLFRSKTEIISLDSRIERVSAAASFLGIVFVLKGPDTLVAAPDGRVVINTNGTPWLATAGSGDVLSGIIGGLLAQRCDAFTAASAGVWLHAEAGRQIGPGLAARDLADGLKQILGRLQSV